MKSVKTETLAYWVMPPPETRPTEYGKPMTMEYSIIKSPCLSKDMPSEMVNKS